METYYNFQRYIDFNDLTFDELTEAAIYICGNLNSPSFIFPYWFDMYSYTSKTFQVIALSKCRGEEAKAKLGEAVCTGGNIINFIETKEHANCHCSYVFFNVVF